MSRATRVASFLLDRWLPEGVSTSDEEASRARFLIGGAFVGLPVLLYFGIRHVFFLGLPRTGTIHLLGAVLWLATPVVLRHSRSIAVASWYAACALWVFLFAQGFAYGGLRFSLHVWGVVVPLGFALLGRARAAVIWTGLFAGQYVTLAVAEWLEWTSEPPVEFGNSGELASLAWFLTGMSFLGIAYYRSRARLETERGRVENVLRAVVEATSGATEASFFVSLAHQLASSLGVARCWITECLDEPPTRVRTLAVWHRGRQGAPAEYDLEGTPCAAVMGGEARAIGTDVRRLFPADRELDDLGLESYAGVPFHDAEGRVVGHLAIADEEPLDVDAALSVMRVFAIRCAAELERQRASRALEESEQRLSAILENARELFAVVDADNRILFVGDSVGRVLGYPADELVGRPVLDLVHADDVDESAAALLRTWRQVGRDRLFELRVRHRAGSWRSISSSALNLESVPGIGGVLISAVDVTDQRQAEEQLRLSQRLDSLGVLAGGIAHDFNNLLTAILANTSLARECEGEEAGALLLEAEEACTQAQRLTRRLLTFAKGGAPLVEPASIRAVLDEVARISLAGSNVRCQFEGEDPELPVLVDRGQIEQVFQNLLINAAQAMPEGGSITIRFGVTAVADSDEPSLLPGTYVRTTVEDHGHGIAPECVDRVFDPFFTTREDGSGLGLATAYSIVRGHRGHIAISSTQGAGTKVDVFLPAGGSAPQPERPEEEEVTGAGGLVLVMDDNDQVRRSLTRVLERLGYETLATAEGGEAIQLLRSEISAGREVAAAILDLTVPGGMGGAEAAVAIREIAPSVRLMVSSGYTQGGGLTDHRELGFDGVLLKPYTIQQVASAMAALMSDDRTEPSGDSVG